MIIVRFDAGLGNQMLQYASYRALQLRYPGIKVRADIRAYNFARIHNGMELERIFPVKLDVVIGKRTKRAAGISRYWYFAMYKLTHAFLKLGLPGFRFIKDKGRFNKDLLDLKPGKLYYLEGQWGNPAYFEEYADIIRKELAFKIPLDEVNEKRAQAIRSGNSVSVHIRRGDYVNNALGFFELSSSDYYPNAFKFITEKAGDAVFYIISDNPEWCRTNLTWLADYKHEFITGNSGDNSYKDLQLMSMCRHNILANSTFSWWGGFLNSNNEKIVICPLRLFTDTEKSKRITEEFYPKSWLKM